MPSVNKVIIIGNLGRDPEVRSFPDGGTVCNITVATTRTWKDKDGGKQEETEWHRVVFRDRLAEIAGEYLRKGRPVYVEGCLKTRKWTDKEGRDNYTTEIKAEQMQLLGDRDGGDQGSDRQDSRSNSQQRGGHSNDRGGRQAGGQQRDSRAPARSSGYSDMDDDSIPY